MLYCSKCGQLLNGDELFCTHCGQPNRPNAGQASGYPGQPGYGAPPSNPGYPPGVPDPGVYGYPPPHPGNPLDPGWVNGNGYLAWAIVCFLLFWPLAIPAVLYASKIDRQNRISNYPAAQYYANRSRIFSLIATCIGGVTLLFSVLLPFSWALLRL